MTTLHEAARMALEALETVSGWQAERPQFGAAADALRAALAASEAQAEPVALSARPLEWDMHHPGQWTDKHHGFCIIYEQSEEKPWGASWGEGDAEDFYTLAAAKAWCQQQLDAWVRRYVVAHPAPPQQPVAWAGPVFQLMPHVIYEAWAEKYPEDASHFKALVYAAAPQQPAPRVPQGWKLVPVEPTEAMVLAAWGAAQEDADPHDPGSIAAWGRMLAAAPQPEGGA